MKTLFANFSISIIAFCTSMCVFSQENSPLEIWYNEPAIDWMTEALPIGNGYIGAMFFGDPFEEHIQFSEGTLWSGGPGSNKAYDFGIKENTAADLEEVRNLLSQGKNSAANALVKEKYTGGLQTGKQYNGDFGDYGAQQTMGDIFIKVLHQGRVENYRRSLDISNALGLVSYQIKGESYTRTFFGNYPSKVMVYEFKSSKKTSYEIRFTSPHVKVTVDFKNGVYSFRGKVADNNMGFETLLKIEAPKGKVCFKKGVIYVKKTKLFSVICTVSTEYTLRYPTYTGNDYIAKNKRVFKKIKKRTVSELKKEHVVDYRILFDRVQLKLGVEKEINVPTNIRLKQYFEGNGDRGMERLYFQYARYLMIAGSRPNSMSMHLQGKWNNSTNPPWAADYHSNINIQMIYWPAEITNLSECHEPFLDYIESLVVPGKIAANSFFKTRGWMVNTMCNAFGYTSPGWGIPWGFFPGGAGWFSQHMWEHYQFTKDAQFLREKAYPVMKEAALFWMDYLTKNADGAWVSSPSYSPEHGGISTGASMDHQIAWDLFNNCIKATEILNIDADFRSKAMEMRAAILKPKIGKWGQLQEWIEDRDDPENKHRHVSHLYALYPGNQITTTDTPVLAEAAKISLLARGDSGTGWSRAWKLNFWARLKDGNHAHKMLSYLLKPVLSKKVEMSTSGGTYSNLLCAHPPFQLDGNMGGAAGIAEMLLQSHTDVIALLPALPDVWSQGEISGLKARGNFEISIKWKKSKVYEFGVKGAPFEPVKIQVNGRVLDIHLDDKGLFNMQLNN
ncbi:MAG: alpha-L-fucosidase [Flavobacteriaceae bacterium]|nr:MAG: alpha-L-fucosidase [Flavobacteriaceae bacterium]